MPRITKKTEVSEVPKERLVVEVEPKAAVTEPVVMPVVEAVPAVTEPAIPIVEPEPVEEETEEKKSAPKWLLFLVGLLIGLGLGVGVVLGWSMYSNNKSASTSKETDVSEVKPSPVVAQITPTPELTRSKLKVRVENGGGIKGAASVGSDYLKGLGYDVVSLGNAEEMVKLTEVKVTAGKREYGQLLLRDLGSKYQVASMAGELTGATEYDALVTVGE